MPHLSHGITIGSLIGHIARIDDPEGFGRVQVVVPLIDSIDVLPNGDDNWIPTTEAFTTNATAGGSHTLLQVGTAVKLDPLYPANGKNWIVAQCVNSRVDRPHPDTNRANGTHGSVTLNGVFDVSNDTDQSRIYSNPHGAVDYFSPEGDRLLQTQSEARMQLTQDGNARLENPLAFTHVSDQGTVTQRSAAGAQSVLSQDGQVQIDSAFAPGLRLTALASTLQGPMSAISAAMGNATGLLQGYLGEAQGVLQSLSSLSGGLQGGPLDLDGITEVLGEASSLVGSLQQGIGSTLSQGLDALKPLQSASALELGSFLVPQLAAVQRVAPLIQQVESLVRGQLSGAELIQQIMSLLPADRALQIDGDRLEQLLGGLNHSPEMQVEAILDEVLPGGFSSIQNLVEPGLHRTVAALPEIVNQPLPTDPIDRITEIERRTVEAQNFLPANLRGSITSDQIRAWISSSSDRPELLLGQIQQGVIRSTMQQLESVGSTLEAVPAIQRVVETLQSGDLSGLPQQMEALSALSGSSLPAFDPQDPQSSLQAAIAPLQGSLPQITQALSQMNQLSSMIPTSGITAALRLTSVIGELSDPTQTNSVYAGVAGAGLRAASGSFSFGSLGGSLFSSGAFSMISNAGGLLMNSDGSMSLSSLSGVQPGDGSGGANDRPVWSGENARVQIDGDVVRLQSLANGNVSHEIRIEPGGIYFGDYRLSDLFTRLDRLDSRLALLEAGGGF